VKQKTSALKTTILGGVIFLIPFVVLLLLAGKVYELMSTFSRPLAAAIGIEGIGEIAVLRVITVLLTVVVCYAAGRLATSERGARLFDRIDSQLIKIFPRYGFIKAMATDLSGEGSTVLPVVMVRFDDQSQLGFEIERSDEQVVVFLPGSPDPWSGAVSFVTPDRVAFMHTDFHKALKTLRLAGRGGLELMHGPDRQPPRNALNLA
jgi:uncharacterized membrane protein